MISRQAVPEKGYFPAEVWCHFDVWRDKVESSEACVRIIEAMRQKPAKSFPGNMSPEHEVTTGQPLVAPVLQRMTLENTDLRLEFVLEGH